MRICVLAAGAGGMYCGSCLRDNALAGALIRAGHTVHLIPLFSPLRTDVPNHTQGAPVFFGGINIYLQHAMRLFRKTPRMFDWLLDRKWLLNAATKHGGSTPPEQLVDLTLDILKGERGAIAKEANRLVDFIRDELKPDIVTLPNLMFMGIAPLLREKLKVPVICELTGEDMFLDALGDTGGPKVRAAIHSKIDSVNKFVATSSHYAVRMAEYLGIARDTITVVYPGLPQEFLAALPTRPRPERPSEFSLTVGYLARICPEKGLGFLVDAMIQLRQRKGFEELELRVAGYLGKRDQAFFRALQKKVDQSPMRGGMTYVGEVNQTGKIMLLNSVDVFSVPAIYPEAKGIYLLEAFATGLCAVQPDIGSFSELMQKTDGGILTTADDAIALADGLAELLQNPQRRHEHGDKAQQIVHQEFTDAKMAEQMLKVFEEARG
jgi:glycosyltransferase involved in cell wall biosynthesis